MKIVIAVDSFKGTLTSLDAGRAIAAGIDRVDPSINSVVVPVADGGEGTALAVHHACRGRWCRHEVLGPLGDTVEARYLILPDQNCIMIEMASASGMMLINPGQYDPLRASTYGTGQLIRAALDENMGDLLIAVGGSATIDGGCGAVQALGIDFTAADGQVIESPIGGGQLDKIAASDRSNLEPRLLKSHARVLCDVTNPLCGPNGAARIFGPQKGANARQVELLERNLSHLAAVLAAESGKNLSSLPRGGAAGGLAAGLAAFTGATLVSGAETVLDLIGFDEHLRGADLLVTGEGCLDEQSLMGKLVGQVAKRAAAVSVPVIAIAGISKLATRDRLGTIEAWYAVEQAPLPALPSITGAAKRLTACSTRVFAERFRHGL